MYHHIFIYSSTDGHLGCFKILAIVNSAIINIELHIFFLISISFYLFVYFAISFFNVLKFSEYMTFTSLVKFISKYLLGEGTAIVNVIVFLVSLSDSSLLVYKNATDFWILILYPATLPYSFIHSSSFLVACLEFSIIISYHLRIMTVLLSPFQFGCLLFILLVRLLWLGLPVLC
uniref:Uncharacterized protein n=1 Tax=Myotis myotis TaxID=51298 RepID=A0A7J7Z467_MYOMY|nr:hypothetical protein mMyoMyo1_010462 [Myotis myotis]